MNLSLPGYVIFRESGHDPKYMTFRGIRESDQVPVLIKTFSAKHPRLNDVSRLKNEYNLLKDLNLPSIIKAYNLEQYQNGYYLILEDTQYVTLEKLMRMHKLDIASCLKTSIHLVQALADLQSQNIIHRDIQPENILVDPESFHVKLTGFNFATKIPRQRLPIKNPTLLEGSLPYMSPEQTGRMNREVDYRTDFYSLGITLYKLFTKELPFTTSDPMELVHAHIAKTPLSPHLIHAEIPEPISGIILKLMDKKAEDRYSSTFSLLQDLNKCLKELEETGKISSFPLGNNDVSNKLQISQKIYGRKSALDQILHAFDTACLGSTQMMLLSGYPGIGKSSIVHEIHKPILEKNGFFISGKYDQYKANIPYSAFIEAFQDLIRQVLTENDDTIAMWKEKIKTALGNNAGVILEVIPEIRLIIGDSIPLQEFDSQATQNRFNFFLQRFISLYASSQTPLVIFLDDLQWIDAASLQLVEMILTTLKTEGLFLIGAFRNNEVSPLHPLMTTLKRISQNGGQVSEIEITPLSIQSVNELIADTLHTTLATCKPLCTLVFSKTHGNPFFINQFLTYLYEENLLYVDSKDGVWTWDIDKIQVLDVSDNVVDLLITKLQRCSPEMQKFLEYAACIGSNFDIRLISTLTNQPLPFMMNYLMEALKEGFILPFGDIHNILWIEGKEIEAENQLTNSSYLFRFLHDKVQQAAYQLMNSVERKNTHYQIGLMLLSKFKGELLEEHIFEVMSQLNYANDLIKEGDKRKEYARMNLMAAEKAMRTVAHSTALEFVKVGLTFMPEDRWESEYELTYKLYLISAEANYLLFNFDEASRLFDQILEYAKSTRDKVAVHVLKVKLYISSVNYKEAVHWGRNGLKLLNVNLPTRYIKLHVIKELILLRLKLFGKEIDTLAQLPTITDPDQLDIIHLLVSLVTPAYLTSRDLFAFVILKGMNLTLKYGNSPMTAYMYASYGIILNSLFEDFQDSFAFGKLGLDINRKYEDQKYAPATKFLVGTFLNPTKNHLKTSIDILQMGYETGTSTGDFINAVFCQGMMITDKYLIGTNIEELRPQIKECMAYVAKIKSHNRGYVFTALKQSIMALIGETYNPSSMQTDEFNEEAFFQMLLDNNYLITLYFAFTFKMQICYLFENYEQAIEIAKRAEKISFSAIGQPMAIENGYYFALALAANYSWKDHVTQKTYLKKIQHIRKKMKSWALASPANYRHKYLLISAEIERLKGHHENAMELYDEAVESAKETSYLQNEGIANELFAKFYLSQNRAHIAKQYLIDSYYAFYRWGASAKLNQLEQKYAGVFSGLTIKEFDRIEAQLNKTEAINSTSSSPSLDLMAVIRATQSISGEILLDRLLDQLMCIVVETAGAEKAFLILEDDKQWMIKAEYRHGTTARPNVSYQEKGNELAIGVINYVLHAKEQAVLDDAVRDTMFGGDSYITEQKPQSILCFPLLHQAKMVGILYLENNLITRAFTPSRVEVLRLLTIQIATALENSLLYLHQAELTNELKLTNEKLEDYSQNLEKRVYDRTRELNEKNKLLEETLQQIKEMQKKLLQQEKVVSQVAVTKSIATEMRTPLNYISNFATLSQELMNEIPSDKAQETIDLVKLNLEKIHEHSEKADEIITSMLEQSRENEGQRELTDLNALIRNYADMVYYSYYKTDPLFSLTIETDYDPTIGKINVFPQNLGRVFYNIIDNACYATNLKKKKIKGNYSPIVSITTKNGEDYATVKIRDNGVGISKEVLSKAFSPFLTTMPAGVGAGIGLSISHDIIVQDHGGKINIESEEGKYTEVTLLLPKF